MNEYYLNISKILKVLEQNLNLTNKVTSIDINQHNRLFSQVEESFNELINYLKDCEENEALSSCLSNSVLKFINVFQVHITSSNNQQSQSQKEKSKNSLLFSQIDKLAIFSLRSLGYFLYSSFTVKVLMDSQVKEITKLIENTIGITKNKNICNYAIWCFSSQSFQNGPISTKLPETYIKLLSETPFNSKTIESEILNSFNTLLQQNIQLYLDSIQDWLPLVFNKLFRVENLINQIEQLKEILCFLIEYYQKKNISVPEDLSFKLLECRQEYMQKLEILLKSKNEVLAIQYWTFYTFFLANAPFVDRVINQLTPIPEISFKNDNKLIKIESFNNWKLFMEGASRDSDLKKEKKKMQLFIAPLSLSLATEKDVDVKKASFSSWMYLLKQFKQSLYEVFPIVFTPIYVNILKKPNFSKSQQTPPNEIENIADYHLGENALLLLVSITSPSQEVRKSAKQKLQALYDVVLETIPLVFTNINASEWLLGNLEPFKLAIQSRYILSDSNTPQFCFNEKIELWNAILKRMSNIDTKDEKYLLLLKDLLLFLQQLFEQMKIEPDEDSTLFFYQTIYKNTIQSIQSSILIGGGSDSNQYLIKNINSGKDYIPIDFFILNIIEFGFKLTSEQTKEHLLPLFEELLTITFSKPLDMSNRLNFIIGVMNDNLDNETTLCYLLRLWSILTSTVHKLIERSHVLLTLPPTMIDCILESISNLLLWPLRAVAGTPYSSDNSMDPCKILTSNSKLWKNTLQSMCRIFSIKTSTNPSIGYIFQTIDDLQLTNHQNYYDFILATSIPLLELYDLSFINGNGASITNNYANKRKQKNMKNQSEGEFEDAQLPKILSNLSNLLVNCHFSKMISNNPILNNSQPFLIINSLVPCFNTITNILKKCKSSTLCLVLLENMESSLILYIKDTKPLPSITSKLDSQEKYQLTLIRDSFINLWDTTLETLIQNNITTSSSINSSNYKYNSKLLEQLELLLISAFTSPVNEIKEKALYFWNETFGTHINSKSLEYPSKLSKTLKKLKDQISIQLPNFNDDNIQQQQTKRPNEINDESIDLDESYDDFVLPNSQLKKVNNNDNKLLNQYQPSNTTVNYNPNTNANNKKKFKFSDPPTDQYVLITKQVENDAATQSMTDHQLEIYEQQKLTRNSSTSFSNNNNNNNNNNSANSNGNNNKYLQDENVLGLINDIKNKLLENQSTQSLLQIQSVSIEITNKINNILSNRLYK
ncbi:hypothetical protein DICPUDRAFT_153522 [Dictyostelium purpureum]|uniref:Telomere-associated protein Rif1 N-terminal domain-containing protein n=1 Tax=Dictyostelium purpureum TaxID=5786 RepID=F0ZP47_DICPU|nr:uncharacterized protein DICPUDRAFT_153522 [Dictyostelium purpureum]EGC34309.1 hypothetical protein DICPUDRAFT_153522 [Dictyostelium purpureum]|eukprot:XP_003289191.1 hypothetical protein DICPUDRAFT_153522 [Dictyostelium purpureum]